jgi:predicted transposase YbfD/YdcC
MPAQERSKLVEALAAVPDPRRQCRNLRHRWVDVLVIGSCGVLCGCDDFVGIEEFGRAKEDSFRRSLELPDGIPSHDTFRRAFQAVQPLAWQRCLVAWLQDTRQAPPVGPTAGAAVAIGGKALRRTSDRARGLGALRLVSAWATANGITRGQVAADGKSDEITAIPRLIDLLDLQGCVVAIDAMGCQKDIAGKIVAKEADDVLALEENQPALYVEVTGHFARQFDERSATGQMRPLREVETGHGRTEARDTYVVPAPPAWVAPGVWVGLASLVMVMRPCVDHATGQVSDAARYFISSLPGKVKRLARVARQHWGTENGLHGVLDVAFNEDRMRQRDRRGIEELALLNRWAVSLLRQDKSIKAGVKCKRKTAGWNEDYLLHLLFDCP